MLRIIFEHRIKFLKQSDNIFDEFQVPGVTDTWNMIMERALEKNVILVPGKAFMCDPSVPCHYMRAAFSVVTPEKMDIVREILLF